MAKKTKSKIITKEEDIKEEISKEEYIEEKLDVDEFISKVVDIINNDIDERDKEIFIEELRDWCEGILVQLEDPEHYMYCNCVEEN